MDAFALLRKQARDRRDKAILAARQEYQASLNKIADLENDLLGRKRLDKTRTITYRIMQSLPVDKPFGVADITAALEAIDDRRNWDVRTVSNMLTRLRLSGRIRRLRRPRRSEGAVYIRTDATVNAPEEAATLKDTIAQELQRGSMTQTELAVRLIERGYETKLTHRRLRAEVGSAMRADRKRFKRMANRWHLAPGQLKSACSAPATP